MAARVFFALDLSWPTRPDDETLDRLTAELDDGEPTAIEERPDGVRVFFATETARDHARPLASAFEPAPAITAISVSDEDWAERSQAGLQAVKVGRITVVPVTSGDLAIGRSGDGIGDGAIGDLSVHGSIGDVSIDGPIARSHDVFIVPSMGFGTGHHQSTRLCLGLLQRLEIDGRSVLDVGTGSGILAIAAWRLGAAPVVAIDVDPDALRSAGENVTMNGGHGAIALWLLDIDRAGHELDDTFAVVTANLTGATLARASAIIGRWTAPGGAIVASGFETDEDDAVAASFAACGFVVVDRAIEGRWTALCFRRASSDAI